jgi:hypothetical protein
MITVFRLKVNDLFRTNLSQSAIPPGQFTLRPAKAVKCKLPNQRHVHVKPAN